MRDRRASPILVLSSCATVFSCGFSPSTSQPVDATADSPPSDAATFVDCNAIHASDPTFVSGTYRIDPDGPGGDDAYNVTCDMVASGGGWTIVFFPAGNLSTAMSTYDAQITSPLLMMAQTVLISYRDTSHIASPDYATFAMPAEWRTQPPMNYPKTDLTTAVKLNDGPEASATVRYGYQGFTKLCTDAWDATAPFGRICVTGTKAPYFAGFATSAADTCSNSVSPYDATACVTERRFSIAVRCS